MGIPDDAQEAAVQSNHPQMNEKTKNQDIVDFEGDDDPYHPLNWPLQKKVTATVCYGLLSSCTTFATSM